MPLWIIIIAAAFGALFLLKMLYLVSTGLTMPITQGALFVPTHRHRIQAVADALPMTPGQVFVDLGCGDGRVLRAMSRRYGVFAQGVDINWPVSWAG
jgi:SAM-dependent methyltransferase